MNDGELQGYGVLRPCRTGYKMGPLFAVKLAVEHRMQEVFGCARMYFGAAPNLPVNEIFGVTTFELG